MRLPGLLLLLPLAVFVPLASSLSLLEQVVVDHPVALFLFNQSTSSELNSIYSVVFNEPDRDWEGGGDVVFPSVHTPLLLHGSPTPNEPVGRRLSLVNASTFFDGLDDYGEIEFTRRLNPRHSFSLEAWVTFTGGHDENGQYLTSGEQVLLSSHYSCAGSCLESGYRLVFDRATKHVRFHVGGCRLTSAVRTALQVWTHVLATFDAGSNRMSLYVGHDRDSTRRSNIATAECADYRPNNAAPFRIGTDTKSVVTPGQGYPTGDFLEAQIAGVAVYGYELAVNRIGRLGVLSI